MIANNILETIGNTPHLKVNRLYGDDYRVYVKLERANSQRQQEPIDANASSSLTNSEYVRAWAISEVRSPLNMSTQRTT